MKRRDFLSKGTLGAVGLTWLGQFTDAFHTTQHLKKHAGKFKNVIFMVSDGMSIGTLTMAHLLKSRKYGKPSNWISIIEGLQTRRSLMDTSSASSLVTDSAAASSAWGGGFKVPNGSLNVGVNGEFYKPILQKCKSKGLAVGCVTTVPITHATPAGFCINQSKRGNQDDIALQYLDLKFDVMLGGGSDFFSGLKRKDKRDLFSDFKNAGFQVAKNKGDLASCEFGKPILGVFDEGGLPYALDHVNNKEQESSVPTLAEMTTKALDVLNKNNKGFVLQIEGGKVDWAAHANDAPALLYDQIAFDDAVGVAYDFAQKNGETLLIITTDHGNANPGLFYGDKANKNFEKLFLMKQTNEWILKQVKSSDSPDKLKDLFATYQGIELTKEESITLMNQYSIQTEQGIYNNYKLPFKQLAEIQMKQTSVSWGSMDHSGDFVELTLFGPGDWKFPGYIPNTYLHNFILEGLGIIIS
ncbi:MAG: alkaline phosphatase [Hydrotalea sp.]|nr:alkaline phosphatase [Hydrotalea sp.]